MKTLNIMQTNAVSGGNFVSDGCLVCVPSTGIPENHYQKLDKVFESLLNGKISNQYQMNSMIQDIPKIFQIKYAFNALNFTIVELSN